MWLSIHNAKGETVATHNATEEGYSDLNKMKRERPELKIRQRHDDGEGDIWESPSAPIWRNQIIQTMKNAKQNHRSSP